MIFGPLAMVMLMLSLAGTAEAIGNQGNPASGNDRQALDAVFLFSQNDMDAPVDTSQFTPPAAPRAASHNFTGRLEIINPSRGHVTLHSDEFGRMKEPGLKLPQLPPLNIEFVQDGNHVIPVQRGPQASQHPYWEWVLEPGRIWDEAGDDGYSRASLPFSLQQRNQNCMHNGMLTFLFRSDGATSRMAYQVVSETCIWLMADLWGVQEIRYTPGTVTASERVIERHRRDMAHQLPVKPIEWLGKTDPDIDPSRFTPRSPEHATIWGLVFNGTHYVGGCQTRHGPYPFCDVIDLPSYSTAKSIFAGLGYMYLEHRYPGIGNEPVTEWIPECTLADNRWRDVTLDHLVNMTTGLFNSADYMVDEGRITNTAFIQGDSHELKVEFACNHYRRESGPGQHWVYHSSDSYLAGLLMDRYLRKKSNNPSASLYEQLVSAFWKPLNLSAVTEYTRRTYDDMAQPFTGYGLTLHPDDILRVAEWINSSDGKPEKENRLNTGVLTAAMQNSARNTISPLASRDLDYRYGFWAAEASSWLGCSEEVWLPFMSGFGGITVVMLPNDMVYYYFSDSGIFSWAAAVVEAHKLRPICDA